MNINEKSELLGICMWLKEQPEYKLMEITDEKSIFYHVSLLKYAELIMRYKEEHKDNGRFHDVSDFYEDI